MCFYHDCEWYASIVEESDGIAEMGVKCDECHRWIAKGQKVHRVYQQEHEECTDCENGYCDCHGNEESHDCECDKPNYGETYDYIRCWDCHLFLEAVERAELDVGCRPSEARPSYEGMLEEIGRGNGDMDDAKRYFKKAKALYPELVKSGYLGWLWREMF